MIHRNRSFVSTLFLTPPFPFITTTQTHFCYLLLLLRKHKPCSFTTQTQTQTQTQDQNFTLSYLINTCNLSPAWALKLSKRINLKSPDQPNAVLNLLKTFGFSQPQLSLLIKRFPVILQTRPYKTLLPKLHFFLSIGISTSDLPTLFLRNAVFLEGSLQNCLLPRYHILKTILKEEDQVISTFKHTPWCLTSRSFIDNFLPNVEFLKCSGVLQGSISHMVRNNLGVACADHAAFVEAVERVKKMGFDPRKIVFVDAVKVVVGTSKEVWEKRLEIYERWGWDSEMCVLAFKRYPHCMLMSEEKVMRTMRFLVKDMGWSAEDVLKTPGVLSPNLDKTIVPRCRVVKALKEKGLVKSDSCVSTFVLITEKVFLERYVSRFQKRVPGLMDLYRGNIDHMNVVL